jgi:hypothetical protein
MEINLKETYKIPAKVIADLYNTCILIGCISAPIFLTNSWAPESSVHGGEISCDLWACLADKY